MLTMRPIELDGSWGAKSKKEYVLDENGEKITLSSGEYKSRKVNAIDWNEQTKAEEWRSDWADTVNRFLAQSNHTERIDHRSFERQGIEQIPTVHMGTAAFQMERKGIKTDRGDINRQVEVSNNQLKQLKARIRKAKEYWYSLPIENAPIFIDIMGNIANSENLNSRWKKIANLKTQASVFIFLQNNNITDMTQLVDKVTKINKDFLEVFDNIKKVDRRLETLTQHLTQYENYKTHKPVYDKYKKLDPKKQETFYEKHSEEIECFKTAQEYLTAIMNGKTTVPQKSWQAEKKKLDSHRFLLYDKFYGLKDEIRKVELLRKGVENIMREDMQERQQTRNHGMEI
jgi:MobA/MobL family.